jgi:hydrogenase-4 component E
MSVSPFEMAVIAAAITAILMAGSMQLRLNLIFYAIETFMIGIATAIAAQTHQETGLYCVAIAFAIIKGLAIPLFLNWTIDKIKIHTDTAVILAAPLAMHLSIVLLGLSYLFVQGLPVPEGELRSWPGDTQTWGMPMIVEMGVLLDVLVGVMIAGLLVFRIQKSFEHIDVTQLTELKD